jgi:AraC family transcriptional regulator of adaptative response / DNA-3-methyladenine glycosylase II
MRLIADGVVDRDGVGGLARRLSFSERHVHRLLVGEVGAGPLALARAQRAQTARVLIETTDLPFGQVAVGAGFGSARQFNETVRAVFGEAPTALRARAEKTGTATHGQVTLSLAVRQPFAATALAGFFAARSVPGLEQVEGSVLHRSMRLPHAVGAASLELRDDRVVARLRLEDMRDLQAAVQRCRRLLDLDADPTATDAALGADPALAEPVAAAPGVRSSGAVDGGEIAVRAIVGQQISVAAARTVLGRLVEEHGEELRTHGPVTRLFPRMEVLADADPKTLPMPSARARTLVSVARTLAAGELVLDAGADREAARAVLLAMPGVGPWTAGYIAMRAFGDPDVLLVGDLAVGRVLARRGMPVGRSTLRVGQQWRPWRSYATHHLWLMEARA